MGPISPGKYISSAVGKTIKYKINIAISVYIYQLFVPTAILLSIFADFIIFFVVASLSHAEVGEDVIESFLWSDLATGDFCENVKGMTQVLGKEVTGEGWG